MEAKYAGRWSPCQVVTAVKQGVVGGGGLSLGSGGKIR